MTNLEQDLTDILNAVQLHSNHGPYCLRKVRNGLPVCHYPKDVTSDSAFVDNGTNVIYEPARNDERMGKYNPYITSFWRANTDFSPILNSK